jgi:protein-S-isoprenylcysteine O-methyltransferase Ste14
MSSVLTQAEPRSLGGVLARTGFPASTREIVLNYASAASLLVVGFAFYSLVFTSFPYYSEKIITPLGLLAIQVVLTGYLLFLPLFYATFPDDYAVKCRLFWRAVANLRRRWPTPKEAVALRAVAVKAFFMPLMIAWLATGSISLTVRLATEPAAIGLYELMLALIILVDLSFFTVAYGVEHPRLKNEIRSVEPTWLGWGSALACYPPFSLLTMFVLTRGPAEVAEERLAFEGLAQLAMGSLMLTLMGIYTWASVALGLKASNLTNRGTVSRGPYAVIRHPAYLCKNLFWWMACVPLFMEKWSAGDWQGFIVIALSLVAWNAIYTVRALTEERHLLADPEYRDYCDRVKWRYIPRVF